MIIKIKTEKIIYVLLSVTILTLTFQALHLGEHFIQVIAWIIGVQDKPYMTPLGMWAMELVGNLLFFDKDPLTRAKLGFEFLHLFGNGIFLIGIFSLYYFIRTKKVIWALFIEGFHFYEHVSLSFTQLYIGKAIGMSTLFGVDIMPWTLLAYRIWWHFIFNLIPSVLVVLALNAAYQKYRNRLKSAKTLTKMNGF